MHVKEHKRYGHCRCRCLHEHCHQGSHHDKEYNSQESTVCQPCQHLCHHASYVEVVCRALKVGETHEEEREAKNELTDTLPFLVSTEIERYAYCDERERHGGDIHLESYQRYYPCCHCGADIRTHDYSD